MRLLAAVVCIFVAMCIALWAASQGVNAAKPVQLYTDATNGGTNIYNPVEQQSTGWQHIPNFCNEPIEGIVCNRTACIWDVDDHLSVTYRGDYLKPGQSATYTRCVIGDTGHVYGIAQHDHALTLEITLDLSSGPDFTLSTTGERLCLGGPRIRDDSPLRQAIPNSDGGTGVPATVTFTVRNDSDRTERFGRLSGVIAGSGNLGLSHVDDQWCPSGFPLFNTGEGGWQGDVAYWWSRG